MAGRVDRAFVHRALPPTSRVRYNASAKLPPTDVRPPPPLAMVGPELSPQLAASSEVVTEAAAPPPPLARSASARRYLRGHGSLATLQRLPVRASTRGSACAALFSPLR